MNQKVYALKTAIPRVSSSFAIEANSFILSMRNLMNVNIYYSKNL